MSPSTVLFNALLLATGVAVALWVRGRIRLERALSAIERPSELDNVVWLDCAAR